MVAETKRSIAAINIFTYVVVSLLTAKYRFSWVWLYHWYTQPRSSTDRYPSL